MSCSVSVNEKLRSEYDATPTRKPRNCLSSLALVSARRYASGESALQAALNAVAFSTSRRLKSISPPARKNISRAVGYPPAVILGGLSRVERGHKGQPL